MNFIYKKWWFQLIVWGGVYIFFFMLMSQFKELKFAALIASYTTFTMWGMNVFSNLVLIPFHKKGHSYAFLISFVSLLTIAFLFGTIEHLAINHFNLDTHQHEHPPLIFFYIRQVFIFGFIFFVNYATYLLEQTTELKIKQKQLHEEKLETELKLLKAQINPHFIFNALNNIYSLTYMKAEKAPESVLKLSEMLRYVFYDCSKDKVPINNEVQYIKNFAAFQQMKSEYKQNISLNVNLSNSLIEISPMLLIPFIENAFKYSRVEEDETAFVTIDISQSDQTLKFNIKNSVPTDNKPLPGSGMGIKNVKQRLEIIYPGAYSLELIENEKEYEVKLNLELWEVVSQSVSLRLCSVQCSAIL